MKKMLCLLICFCILLSCNATVFADDVSAEADKRLLTSELPEDVVESVSQIPIYVTYIDDWKYEDIDVIKETANQKLNIAFSRKNGKDASLKASSTIYVDEQNFVVTEVSEKEKQSLFEHAEFNKTFIKTFELIKQDVSVNYINIFLPTTFSLKTSGGDANDPSYWENNCPKLCPTGGSNVYKGYKFLYLESSVNVETTPKVAGNIASMNWTSIATKFTKLAADLLVKNAYYNTVSVAYEALSAVFSGYSAPYSVTYSASSGYLKTWVSGDLYMRTILISDNLNRISGYAYYEWGFLEMFKAKTKVDAKWPISVRPGGSTYNYNTRTYTYPNWREVKTPGFDGNAALYQSVINLYQNTTGYFTHDETIDVDSVIASII